MNMENNHTNTGKGYTGAISTGTGAGTSKSHALTGTHNQRILATARTDNESTAAWAGKGCLAPKTNVTIPSASAVEHAKEWVDDGSKL